MKKRRNSALTAVILALSCLQAHAQMTFTPLGHVGGSFGTGAYDVSADGSVVVGKADFASGPEAFRWTRDGGMVGLGDLPGGPYHSAAYGVSADGSVVVGQSSQGFINGGWGAFRWTSTEGMVSLGWGTAWDVSVDGSVVVGEAGLASGREAFRWTRDGGMVGLGGLPGEPVDSTALGVSADGSVVVGISSPYAFRWTSGGGMVRLNDLSGASFNSRAQSASADGSVIVGGADKHPISEAFRWTSEDGMVGLGQPPGEGSFSLSYAFDVSADGSVIVGIGNSALGHEAFLWTAGGGMQNLRELLIDGGASGLTGWTLTTASAITPDGRTIVGTGTNPLGLREAWLATIPEPNSFTLAALMSFALLAAWARRRLSTPMKKTRNCLVAAVILALPCTAAHAQMTFTPLGDLPGGTFQSAAFGVSADGSVVVGDSRSASGFEAFRWTRGGGMVGLGDLPGGPFQSESIDVSADGSVVVGVGNSASDNEAFRWTSGGGMVGLGDMPGGDFLSQALGVSADGSVVAGFGTTASGFEAFRWTAGGGMVGLGDLPGEPFFSGAFGNSDDGTVVVGVGNAVLSGTTITAGEAFRWTAGGGMVGLGDLPGGIFLSIANGVSADGSVVVGVGNGDDGTFGAEAFRWTAGGGMVGLGDLPGGNFSSTAWNVSADGSVIVGSGTTALGREAFLWTSAGGMQSLRDLLIAGRATGLTGWTLTSAGAISADGRVIVGTGRNPSGQNEGWIAVIPEPTTLTLGILGSCALLMPLMRRK